MEMKPLHLNTPEEQDAQGLSRRELLKVLAATGGGLAAVAFLPGKWIKPVIESGVLPAHAQGSCVLGLSNLVINCMGVGIGQHPNLFFYTGSIDYTDSCCEVGLENVDGEAWSDNHSVIEDQVMLRRGSTPCEGTIDFSFWADPPTVLHGIIIINGRESEQIDIALEACDD